MATAALFIWAGAGIGQAEILKTEARLKAERESLEKEKRMLMGTASSQDSQVGGRVGGWVGG